MSNYSFTDNINAILDKGSIPFGSTKITTKNMKRAKRRAMYAARLKRMRKFFNDIICNVHDYDSNVEWLNLHNPERSLLSDELIRQWAKHGCNGRKYIYIKREKEEGYTRRWRALNRDMNK